MSPATAITPTASWTIAAANIAIAMPGARNKAAVEPNRATASTAPNMRLAGLSSSPMIPTAPLIQMIRKAAAIAIPTAARNATISDDRTVNSITRPTLPNMMVAKMKSNTSQFTSLVNCIATAGSNSSMTGMLHNMGRHGIPRRFGLRSPFVISPFISMLRQVQMGIIWTGGCAGS